MRSAAWAGQSPPVIWAAALTGWESGRGLTGPLGWPMLGRQRPAAAVAAGWEPGGRGGAAGPAGSGVGRRVAVGRARHAGHRTGATPGGRRRPVQVVGEAATSRARRTGAWWTEHQHLDRLAGQGGPCRQVAGRPRSPSGGADGGLAAIGAGAPDAAGVELAPGHGPADAVDDGDRPAMGRQRERQVDR